MIKARNESFHAEVVQYAKEHTVQQCAEHFDKQYKTMQAYCKKHCIAVKKESKEGANNPSYKHGYEGKSLCNIYRNMLARCYNSNRPDYIYYGARGIEVCDEWKKDSVSFFSWAESSGYSEGLTLDRIDVNGGYSPLNCRWVSMKVQSNNRRSNKIICYKGVNKNLKQWSDELNIPYDLLRSRLRRMSVEEAFEYDKLD